MTGETILVTGAAGCIGAWVLRHLTDLGHGIVAADLVPDRARPALHLDAEELAAIDWATLDVTDTEAVCDLVAGRGITRIVHLAGLQIPFCRANPPLGASVNVTGTVNILEAARRSGIQGLAYASSLAVMGPPERYPPGRLDDSVQLAPDTLYGVYKVAGEEAARVYWQDWQVGSVGLRPAIVYGPGRDQGMSADIAKALLATAAGRPFHIRFGGRLALQHASDVAEMFIAAALAGHQGAAACHLRGDVVEVADVVARLMAQVPDARITFAEDAPLPFPADLDDSGLRAILGPLPHIPLETAIARDLATFRTLVAENRIDLAQLES